MQHTCRLEQDVFYTFCLPPDTTLYCAFFGSVCTSMRCWQQGAVMVKDHILVLWYLPISCFSALNRTPLPIKCPQPSHQTLKGISNLQVRDRSQSMTSLAAGSLMTGQTKSTRTQRMIATRPTCLITKMPWSIFLARSLRGCWPCCLFMLPFLGSHSGGK